MNRESIRLAGVTLTHEKPASKRRIAKDYHRNLRRIDEPDEVRKVAGCPKCSAWFESVEMRNEHKLFQHGKGALLVTAALARIDMAEASGDAATFYEEQARCAEEMLRRYAVDRSAAVNESSVTRRWMDLNYQDEPWKDEDGNECRRFEMTAQAGGDAHRLSPERV